jgi:predicted DNA-binding protein (MmcQ/YjbR family)
MHLDDVRARALAMPGAFQDTPFGPDTLTIKVMGKIFLFCSLDEIPAAIAVKGDPERLAVLREEFESVTTGPYLDRNHWVRVILNGTVPDRIITELVDRSYALVVKGLTKAQRAALDAGTASAPPRQPNT